MNLDISLDLYKVFCTVVQLGNMSIAAKSLYISQPAVSMAIRQLETKLGGALLVRTAKGVRTTAEGEMLYRYLEQALGLITTAEKKYVQMVNLDIGEVRIGASDTILSEYILPYLEEYSRKHSNVNIKVTNRTTGGTLNLLKNGMVDIGFVNMPINDEDDFDVTKCLEVQDVLVGGSEYKDLAESGIELGQLSKYPVLLLERDSNTRKFLDEYALENGFKFSPQFELAATSLLIRFAQINLGLTVLTKQFSQDVVDNCKLFEIPIYPPIPKRHIGMLRLKNVEYSNAAREFAAMFR